MGHRISGNNVAILLCGAGLSVLALTSPANAQDAAATGQITALDANDIIVTAQRRAERLEEVPVAITAVTAQTLEQSGVSRFQDLGQIAIGAQVQRTGGHTQPAIRGVSTLTTGPGYENNVAVYVDGFYQSDTMAINGDLVNVADVQVLKGPQGTLYGRNATAGAILVNTLQPSDVLTGNAQVSYGRFNDVRIQGYLSGPINDTVAFSIAGYTRENDGYIKDIDSGKNVAPFRNDSIRTKLRIEPSEDFSLTLAYNYAYVSDSRGLVYNIYRNPSPALPAPPARATDRNTASLNFNPENGAKMHEATITTAVNTGIGTLTSYTGYAVRHSYTIYDFDGSRLPLVQVEVDPYDQRTFQQTLDFAVDSIEGFDLVVGGMYYHDVVRNVPAALNAQLQRVTGQDLETTGEAVALYVDGTVHVTDRLFLTLGGRYSSEKRIYDYVQRSGVNPATDQPILKEATFSKFTPRVVLRYEVADRTNVYASYSQGFRSGLFPVTSQPRAELVLPVQPEEIDAFEIGFKTASSMVRFDAAAYYYDYTNLQVGVTVPSPVIANAVINLVSNAKAARVYGVEGQLTVTPTDGLNIRAGAAYNHARYRDFSNATGNGWNAVTGLNISNQIQDWSDKEMARAPKWNANLGFDYSVDVAGGNLVLAANGSYMSSHVVQNPSLWGPAAGPELADQQRYRQDGYAVVNASINWTDPSDTYTIGVYGENLTNTKYLISHSGGAFGDWRNYGQPVSYGVRLGAKF